MTILQAVYASAPTSEVIIPTLEIQIAGLDPIRICADFVNHTLGVDGVMHEFECGSLQVALPSIGTTGSQALTFGLWNTSGRAQRYVDHALESGEQVLIIYRAYLASDKSAPAERPYTMTLSGGAFEGDEVQFEASYRGILDWAYPRDRFNSETAPGLRFL